MTDQPSATRDSVRHAAVVSCWLCGFCTHSGQMIPDGGSACDDIRWYCQDAQACTERWTMSRGALAHTGTSTKGDGIDSDASVASEADRAGAVTTDVAGS